ncbi:hypothetical protein [Alysiella filiformis]|uniref:hypothetical protein n=1 Tax=Alysiella filiformis TaxID=194196 RepID=UPI0015F7747B|nr:hypothetical protein [Alysiella filiformis]QMT31351.1 hypothetical protein H3L97_00035 [Alysiella filiformis]
MWNNLRFDFRLPENTRQKYGQKSLSYQHSAPSPCGRGAGRGQNAINVNDFPSP